MLIARHLTTRVIACLLFASLFLAPGARAHPADEFCTPDSGMDPALCRALAELDSADVTVQLEDERFGRAPEITDRPWTETFSRYVQIGIGHILPGGLDHILFVLALVASTSSLKRLALQISAFTLAHTATLGLAAAGVVSPPAEIVEPLIAATIAFVALEAVWFKQPPPWRVGLVFLFGLVHGLGFAGFFGSLGLPENQFIAGLVGFNVGVEIGQLSVAALALALLMGISRLLGRSWRADGPPRLVTLPIALGIGATGLYWTITRIVGSFS
ncbi:MAG: HupE/UreJ family protein [Hyphomonadaceae bacterium]|nr:HupE/UreJ family protein [Hyphomonadaceae bacterium]